MKKIFLSIVQVAVILSIGVGSIFLASLFTPKEECKKTEIKTKVITNDIEIHTWQCHMIVTCPHVDWRYYDSIDVCTYEDTKLNYPTNPIEYPDNNLGEHCELIK